MKTKFKALSYFLITLIFISCFSIGKNRKLAEELAQSGQVDQAIIYYRKHIKERSQSRFRADGENPYFYHILIGDLLLKNNRPHEALDEYLIAKEQDVDHDLVISRLRRIAIFYEEHEEYVAAILVLKVYRHFDPEVFDATIDRVFRKQIKEEQQLE